MSIDSQGATQQWTGLFPGANMEAIHSPWLEQGNLRLCQAYADRTLNGAQRLNTC